MTYEVAQSRRVYDGSIIRVRVDTVEMPGGSRADREVVEHADSVAVVAVDDRNRVLMIRQYRHPAGQYLWELPAGLRDQPGEPPLETARRELAEETGLAAGRWSTLVDLRPSPGMSTETVRVYLAAQLRAGDRSGDPAAEERDLETRWIPLAQALAEVFAGRITNGLAVTGLLAAGARFGLTGGRSRPADDPWPDS
jgi:ADP-ribose pyrophosphatase